MKKAYWVIGLIAAVIVLLSWFFSDVLFYIVISAVIATALRPIVNLFTSYEVAGFPIPRVVAIGLSYLSLASLISLFVLLLAPLITDQVVLLRGVDINKAAAGLIEPVKAVEAFVIERGLTSKEPGFMVDVLQNSLIEFVSNLDVSVIFGELISFTGSIFIGLLAVGFITSFMLYERGILRKGFVMFVPNKYFEIFINALHKIEKLLSNYLLGLLFQMFTIFTLASIGLSIVGVKYALTIALVAATANVIPYLGPIIGSLFGIVIGLIPSALSGFTDDTLILVIKICSVFAIVQITDNVVVQPLIFSKSVKAHPLEIFVIIFVGATIGGIVGMIAAIPVYTIVRVSISELYKGSRRYRVFNMS